MIESAYAGTMGGYAFWMLVIAAMFTSFYSWRLMFLTFFGAARGDKHTHEHAHESPKVMLVPACGAGGWGDLLWYGLLQAVFWRSHKVEVFFGIVEANAGMTLTMLRVGFI